MTRRVPNCCLFLLTGLTLISLAPAAGFAAWPHDSYTNLPLCTAPGSQILPTIVSDGLGGAIVTWEDRRGSFYDIYAQHVLASGSVDPSWPVNGLALCTATGDQTIPVIVSDGSGGAIVAWIDTRNGPSDDIYAQHVLASGTVDPAWPADGQALCTAPGNQYNPSLVSDGSGGAIATWQDARGGANYDIYAQHVLASGSVDANWPTDGRALCTAAGDQDNATIVSDGSGGAIVTWYDIRSGTNYDIYAQHVLASGAVDGNWPVNGRGLCTAAGDQFYPTIVADGSGGAVVTWYDRRGGANYDIYAQHVVASGSVDPNWPTDGRALCTAAADQTLPTIASDGTGGAIVTWSDTRNGTADIYVQHVQAAGAVDPAWPANGRALCTATGDQFSPTIVSDGAGGAIVTWYDSRSVASYDIYAQHVLASGVVDAFWPTDGRAVCTASATQSTPTIVSDGSGGAIVAWYDFRSGTSYDVYAQRVERFGYLGSPEPAIAAIRDVPNDQGSKVKLSWYASYLEPTPFSQVTSYQIFRSLPPNFAARKLRQGARVGTEPQDFDSGRRSILQTVQQGATYFWEYVASQSAYQFAGYSYYSPTAGDSTGAVNEQTYFLVRAVAPSGAFWNSAPDSGYSVDNLAPATPTPFLGNFSGNTTALHWGRNVEADLKDYRLYRGSSSDFIPGPGNLVIEKPDTGYVDAVIGANYYKLSAMDVHGNESRFAVLTPQQTGGVSGQGEAVFSLGHAVPNPARSDGATISYSLPRSGRAVLAVFDARGARVRTLLSGVQPAGEGSAHWDGRDERGTPAGSGLYFYSLTLDGKTLSGRLVWMR